MELLVFAIVASRKQYHQTAIFVSEPSKFNRFDLRALRRSYESGDVASVRWDERHESLVAQTAS